MSILLHSRSRLNSTSANTPTSVSASTMFEQPRYDNHHHNPQLQGQQQAQGEGQDTYHANTSIRRNSTRSNSVTALTAYQHPAPSPNTASTAAPTHRNEQADGQLDYSHPEGDSHGTTGYNNQSYHHHHQSVAAPRFGAYQQGTMSYEPLSPVGAVPHYGHSHPHSQQPLLAYPKSGHNLALEPELHHHNHHHQAQLGGGSLGHVHSARYMTAPLSYADPPLPTPNATPPPAARPQQQYARRRSATADASLATGPARYAEGLATSDNGSMGTSHKMDRELKKMSLYKTELCRSWEETGTCRYGTKCQFAHSQVELRPVDRHPKYKTEMCKTFWEKGTCPYGKRCCFIHTENVERNMKGSGGDSGGDKTADGLQSPTEEVDQQSANQARTRARTMSTGSLRNAGGNGTSGDMRENNVSNGNGQKSLTSPAASQVYDHRAIADAYFSGRRPSNANEAVSPIAEGYMHGAPNAMDRLSLMMRNTHIGSSSSHTELAMNQNASAYAEARRLSTVDPRNDSHYGDAQVDGNIYPHHHHQQQYQQSQQHPSSLRHIPNSVMHNALNAAGGGGDVDENGEYIPNDNASAFATPPRERTRRSRSVTQPAGFVPPDVRPWGKNRSESFSGYLPGSPLPQDQYAAGDYYTQLNAARHQQYLAMKSGGGNNGGGMVSSAPSSSTSAGGYYSGPASFQMQHQQLLSPPPSGHPSPVRETILEEEHLRDEGDEDDTLADGGGPGIQRRRTQSFGHRLPIFKTIKRTVA
ncbi:hypothetical protein PhCBS80983_g05270 [Powellomyces hirtus]|uniref:C3H1-type domain-containing protein n=1 Tax=Powellomyces hirtus TaxID=109895 RepID=A0A507DWD5_9FUNG|nr:hypothetical protein PhCBS80983_g05270 [Powellomyces hirtus]